MRSERYTKSLDELETDLIVTTLYETERPPQGVCGLIDWRLHGFLSRMILNGIIKGAYHESVLIPLHKRISARRLLVLGLGEPKKFDLFHAREIGSNLGKVLANLKINDVAVTFPQAVDENIMGQTEKSILEAIEHSETSRDIYIRWLDASVIEH